MSAREPPRDLGGLRSHLERLQGKNPPGGLGRRAVKALTGMMDAPNQAAVFSISDLARINGVNPSTLTRLAQRLGYKGFGELQDVFRRHVAGSRDFYSRQADVLVHDGPSDALALIARLAEGEIANIGTSTQNVGQIAVLAAVATLAAAGRVRILGLRQCFSAAHLFAYGLGLVRGGVHVMGNPGGMVAEELAELRHNDALVVISFAPYTRDTLAACEVAVEGGTPVIALTDSSDSPLARSAAQTFVVATGGPLFFNSMGAVIVLIEALVALVARHLGDQAVAELKRRELLFARLQTETGGAMRAADDNRAKTPKVIRRRIP